MGDPEGNRRETGAPKGPGLVAAVCTSPAVNPHNLAGSPRPPSPAPAGQLPNTGTIGRCTLWKLVSLFSLRCSYLEVCRNLKGLSVPAKNCRRRALHSDRGVPRGCALTACLPAHLCSLGPSLLGHPSWFGAESHKSLRSIRRSWSWGRGG